MALRRRFPLTVVQSWFFGLLAGYLPQIVRKKEPGYAGTLGAAMTAILKQGRFEQAVLTCRQKILD